MNYSAQPISAFLPLNNSQELGNLALPSLEKAFALQPGLASQAAGQAMTGLPSAAPMPSLSQAMALNPLSGAKSHTDAELRAVSKKFEAIFMQMMLKEMRNSVQKSGLMGNSQATDFFESMHDEQLSQELASRGGIGIGNMIYEKLKQTTEPHQKMFS